jgi:hypothetical protein
MPEADVKQKVPAAIRAAAAVRTQVATLDPSARFLELSARTGEGTEGWRGLPEGELARKRAS